ncbi:hypothetical protein [Bradyrhizobium sp. SZCCHNS1054]|uniref:hypothetical protein n=1 Tax=Bradyrhizobium sp. SZCCHNS1054 TaxID=3057301 RepID=UPI002915CC67|nr:hypothetical protein [Bradyrhizobium sp. SZCCHNS1054]
MTRQNLHQRDLFEITGNVDAWSECVQDLITTYWVDKVRDGRQARYCASVLAEVGACSFGSYRAVEAAVLRARW